MRSPTWHGDRWLSSPAHAAASLPALVTSALQGRPRLPCFAGSPLRAALHTVMCATTLSVCCVVVACLLRVWASLSLPGSQSATGVNIVLNASARSCDRHCVESPKGCPYGEGRASARASPRPMRDFPSQHGGVISCMPHAHHHTVTPRDSDDAGDGRRPDSEKRLS